MGIDYRFNTWRETGEKAEAWSPMAYRLLSKKAHIDTLNGFNIGNILYLHHLKGMEAKEIRKHPVSYGIPTNTIKAVLRGFKKKYMTVSHETVEAYQIAMYMIEHEPEVLEKMYQIKVSKMEG